MYIYEHSEWPHVTWDSALLLKPLSKTVFLQAQLLGRMKSLGFTLQKESSWYVVAQNIIKSSEIEGEHLSWELVRSSVARKLNIHYEASLPSSHHVDGVVEMAFNASEHYDEPLTFDRLFRWHAALFPTGYSGLRKITVGNLRSDLEGPMQVVSQRSGPNEMIYFHAPPAANLRAELTAFLEWFNGEDSRTPPLLRATIAHLWFITLHPFEDGNGRIARNITDMALSRADQSSFRFYSMSDQIQKQKNEYYDILERTQKGSLDITAWISWFLECLTNALGNSQQLVSSVLRKAHFWQEATHTSLNENQQKMLTLFLDDFQGNLTSSKWAKICKISQDTAIRELRDLVQKGILIQQGKGRSTHYVLSIDSKQSTNA